MGVIYLLVFMILFQNSYVVHSVIPLIFANRKDIREIDLESRSKNSSKILISNLEDATALDYDYNSHTIFWADAGSEEIKSMTIDDPKSVKSIVDTDLISPDGLAWDWCGRNLYWTDSETNRIEVCNFNGSIRKVLFSKNLDQPRAIAVIPDNGLMVWSDWGESPKIEKASMDGNNASRRIIVSDNIIWPNGIAVDRANKRIYWTDAKLKSFYSVDYDGHNRHVVAQGQLRHPFSLDVNNKYLCWTDWTTKSVHCCNMLDGCSKQSTYGGFLSPMGIHVYHPDRQPYSPTSCDESNKNCSHLCLLSSNYPFYSCACPTGVRLKSDGKNCEDGPQEFILAVLRSDIRIISLDTSDYTPVVQKLEGIKHAIAVDYDQVDQCYYWTDDEARVIRRACLNGTGQEDIIVTEVQHPDGIAIDSIARNMYWTDTGTDRIEVARLNGTSRKILITENLNEPRAIVVDPADGYMYWTDWGVHPKIEKAALDGTQRRVLINDGLGWPNGLAIDYQERKLFWGDAKTDKIEVSDLNGKNRRELVSDNLHHIFGFTLRENSVCWSDWQSRKIECADKVTGMNREVIVDQLPDLMGLKAIKKKSFYDIGTNPCAVNNGNCSHLCLNRPNNNFTCSCPGGLELSTDNTTCIVPEAFLLVSSKDNIRRMSLKSNHDDAIPLSGVQEANALDYYEKDNQIYWTDTSLKTINRAFMNGSAVEKIVEFGLIYVEDIEVDWVAKNLYWTDMGSNRIEVSRLNGTSRKILLWQNMDDPRSIAVNPPEGKMYWSVWDTSGRIEQATLGGLSRKVIISNLGRPNGLTIDYIERRLYWMDIDALRIESSDLSGNHRVQIIKDLSHPYGLTLFEDNFYWTDWKTNIIYRANKTDGGNRTIIQRNLDHVMDISVFHTSRQLGWNPCAVHNGGCEHLCLALPQSLQQKSLTHHCGCPTHFQLAADNKTCLYPKKCILFSQRNSISRFLVDTVDSPDVTLPIHGLKNIKDLDYDPVEKTVLWIDGRTKTVKKSLIDGTKNSVVVPNPTNNNHPYDLAVDPYRRIVFSTDSQHNTINATTLQGQPIGIIIGDEDDRPRLLALHPDKGYVFFTNMVHPPLIERANLDGHMRRILVSSGLDRPVSLAVDTEHLFFGDMGKIERATFSGANRKVILTDKLLNPTSLTVLDGNIYWTDPDQQIIETANKMTGLDRQRVLGRMPLLTKLLAVNSADPEHYLNHPCAVKNGGCSHLCLLTEDGKKRCACPMDLVLSTDRNTCIEIPVCPEDKFRCQTGVTCLPLEWRCDGIAECDDMSDEMNCHVCKPHQFRCVNGDCIDAKYKCDGTPQCKDYSDEKCCGVNLFYCPTYECILQTQVCDSRKDCSDGADERDNVCAVTTSLQHASDSPTPVLPIAISVSLVVVFALFLFHFLIRRCNIFCKRKSPGTEDVNAIMLPNMGDHCSTVSSCPRDAAISSFRTSSVAFGSVPVSGSSVYDRNYVTGASSSSSSRTYEPYNPPPSPMTVHSQGNYNHWSMASYKYYRSRNRRPLPTPCSTDVCNESDPSFHYSSGLDGYDSDPFIPPPPTSPSLSDENSQLRNEGWEAPPPSPTPGP